VFKYPLDVSAIAVDPVTSLLAIGTGSGFVHIFGGPSVEIQLVLPEPAKVRFLSFANATFQLVCLDERSQLYVWELSAFGKPKLVAATRFDNATSLVVSPSHSHAFIALESGEIRTYDLLCLCKSPYKMPNMWALYEAKTMADQSEALPGSEIPVEVVVHPRDLNLLFVAYSGGVILSDLTQRNTLRAFELVLPAGAPGGAGYGHPDIMTHRRPPVTAIAIHPAGHFFAVGYADGCIAFWAVEDEDQPLAVRTIDATDVNVVDIEKLESSHELQAEREPIFKLAWSSYANSTDPRGGTTTLTVLGGMSLVPGDPTGFTVLQLPAFNPGEPPTPAPNNVALHPFMRSAMQMALTPLSDYFYYTSGVAQDFFLVPKSSPHFAGHHDPQAILVPVESIGGARVVQAYQFPPQSFLEAVAAGADAPAASVEDELADTLKAMTLTEDPKHLRLPVPLHFGGAGVFAASLFNLDKDNYSTFVNEEDSSEMALPLSGGVALNDEDHAREMRLAKFQAHRILMTQHRDLSVAVQFHDLSAQLLVTGDAPLDTHFPKPLPGLTIDLSILLTDPAVVNKSSPDLIDRALVQTARLSRQSLECAVLLASGELFIYRFKSASREPREHFESSDEEIVPLAHVFTAENARFSPYFVLSAGKPVTAFAMSDIGFLAVAHGESLLVVDMRGPRVIFRKARDKKKDRLSMQLHSADVGVISGLTWTVATTEDGGCISAFLRSAVDVSLPDHHLRIRLIVGHSSGSAEVLMIGRDATGWKVEADGTKGEMASNPLAMGTFVIDIKHGKPIHATKEQLGRASQDSGPTETDTIFVTAGAKGAKSFKNVNGPRIGKTDWGNKTGNVISVQIVEKMSSRGLVAFTDKQEVLTYSLPTLEHLYTLKLPLDDNAIVSCDESGDWIAYYANGTGCILEKIIYGTVFDFRRAFFPPDINLAPSRRSAPAQPQPVSLGPTSVLSSWFRFGQSMTGDQLDALMAGPDRPIPEPPKGPEGQSLASYASALPSASSVAQSVSGVQNNLYSRLQSAMGERSQMLGDLEDRFNSLHEGSQSMVSQAKRLAAEQSAKRWFGL
ncbi:unnamed protein product, partial [Mycena citricolor]